MAVDDQYTKSLLHFDGGITDESGKTWTAYGGAATSTTQSKFGSGALYLDTTGKYISVSGGTGFDFANMDFGIDMWVYLTSVGVEHSLVSKYSSWATNNDFLFYITNSNYPKAVFGNSSVTITSSIALSSGAWYHVALIRNGTNWKIFVNGEVVATTTASYTVTNNTASVRVGYSSSNDSQFFGYIDELRISKGIARWTSNFTPPTAPYPIIIPSTKKSLIHPSLLSTQIGYK